MKHKLAPRLPKVDAPPVLMKTWVVRLYQGKTLKATSACFTEQDALEAACDWRTYGEEFFAETEVITQERRLR